VEHLVVGGLMGLSVTALGAATIIVGGQRRVARRARERALSSSSEGERPSPPRRQPQLLQRVQRLGEALASKKGTSVTLKEQLAAAGYHSSAAAAVYLGTKMILLASGVLLLGPAVLWLQLGQQGALLLVGAGALLLFFLPNLAVAGRKRRRQIEVRDHLPDAVDLLEICVSAGMGMDMAWNAVSDEIRRVSGRLADEMELTNLEISLGVSRTAAMRNMSKRTGVEDISSLVAMLSQSERFGASILESLRVFAQSMREVRSQRAEEAAEKAAVKLLLPMIAFIFPALFVVMAGPALLAVFETLTQR
jgi:tight adherence protein C